jgi:methylglutamate dehydrogenase subunit C
MVLDDGLVLRLGEDRFLATTSSSHGAHMLSHFELYRDAEFAGRDVAIADVTDEWAVIAAAGPASRDVVGRTLGGDWPARLDDLPHMAFAAGRFAGRELRVLRASFSGERAYELHCSASVAPSLWEALRGAGLQPYGLEALDILRVEKGYLTSAEINGQTTPYDLGMGDLVKPGTACVGADLLGRPAFHEPTRPRLVGLRAADGRAPFLAGAQLVDREGASRACGHVTSSVYSPTLGQWIGIGLLARAVADSGGEIIARDPVRQGDARLTVVSPVHFDPEGQRMKC